MALFHHCTVCGSGVGLNIKGYFWVFPVCRDFLISLIYGFEDLSFFRFPDFLIYRFLYFPDGFTPLFEAVERVLAEVEVADRWNEDS